MITLPAQETLPFVRDARGVLLIAGTRVPLETVVSAFERGATAEGITQQFPALALGDVYAVIGFFLRQRGEVDAYLHDRASEEARIREENEARHPAAGVRDRLLARRSS